MAYSSINDINKCLKKQGLPALTKGENGLHHFGFDSEFISILATLQEALGISLLLHWEPKQQCYTLIPFGKSETGDVPQSALHLFTETAAETEQKFALLNAAENLLNFYQ